MECFLVLYVFYLCIFVYFFYVFLESLGVVVLDVSLESVEGEEPL